MSIETTLRNGASSLLRGSFGDNFCRILPLGFDHTEAIVTWRNDPEIAKWFMTAHKFEKSGHEAWLAKTLLSETDFNWIITEKSGELVGTVALYNVDWVQGRAEFGRLMVGAEAAKGKGYARYATGLVIAAAQKAGLSEIFLELKIGNERALGLYRSIGFQEAEASEATIRMVMPLVEHDT